MWIWYQHAIPLLATRNLGFDWDVYPLPSSRQAATYADWSFVSMNTNTTEVDAAWDLMRYLAGPDGDQRALRTGIAAPVVRGSEVRFMTGEGIASWYAQQVSAPNAS